MTTTKRTQHRTLRYWLPFLLPVIQLSTITFVTTAAGTYEDQRKHHDSGSEPTDEDIAKAVSAKWLGVRSWTIKDVIIARISFELNVVSLNPVLAKWIYPYVVKLSKSCLDNINSCNKGER